MLVRCLASHHVHKVDLATMTVPYAWQAVVSGVGGAAKEAALELSQLPFGAALRCPFAYRVAPPLCGLADSFAPVGYESADLGEI